MKPHSVFRNEAALQRRVLEWLRSGPGFWENRAPSFTSKSGVADITGCLFGRFVAIELKHPKTGRWSDVTPAQRAYLKEVVDNGGYALATNSLEAVQEYVNDFFCSNLFIRDFRR